MIVTELTQRALRDVKAIDRYSARVFGDRKADQYIADIQDAIAVISENPGLLQTLPEVSKRLSFYRVQRHRLVCVEYPKRIYVSMILLNNIIQIFDLPDINLFILSVVIAL